MKIIRQKIKRKRSSERKKGQLENGVITEQDNDEQSTKAIAPILPNITTNIDNSANINEDGKQTKRSSFE